MLDSCVSLFLEIVFSHKIVGVAAFLLQTSVILPRGCQSARSDDFVYIREGSGGKGTRTPDIQLAKLALYQLSYAPRILERKDRDSCRRPRLRGVDLRTYRVLLLHRKEVIQPQVPLRLPCYDFIPVTSLTLGPCLLTVGS